MSSQGWQYRPCFNASDQDSDLRERKINRNNRFPAGCDLDNGPGADGYGGVEIGKDGREA